LTVAGNGQPTAIWHSFDDVTLYDGQWVQLAVRVRLDSTNIGARDRDVRVALAYDNGSPLPTDTTVLAIPYTGYFVTASANKSSVVARFSYVDGASTAKNFFNSADGVINTSAGIPSTVESFGDWKILVLKFENVTGELQMSARLDGEDYGVYTVDDATSGTPQEMFTFNAVGLAYAYNIGERVNYETLSVKYGGSRTFDVNSYRLGSDPADDWGVTIRRAVSNAQEYASLGTEHSAAVSFSNQVYVLAERTNIWAQILLFEAERITLNGNGAELLCHPGNRPFALWKSSEIEINNFQLD